MSYPKNDEAIDEWRWAFDRAGLDGYAIDFSNVESKTIEAMGRALAVLFPDDEDDEDEMQPWGAVSPLCSAKHTTYQPTEKEFCCPACGAVCGEFYVCEEEHTADPECGALHEDDVLECASCHSTPLVGRSFAKRIADKKGLVKCTTCKGTGSVKAPKSKKPAKKPQKHETKRGR